MIESENVFLLRDLENDRRQAEPDQDHVQQKSRCSTVTVFEGVDLNNPRVRPYSDVKRSAFVPGILRVVFARSHGILSATQDLVQLGSNRTAMRGPIGPKFQVLGRSARSAALARVEADVLKEAPMQFAEQSNVEIAVRECAFVHVGCDADKTLGQRTLFGVGVGPVIIPQDELLT